MAVVLAVVMAVVMAVVTRSWSRGRGHEALRGTAARAEVRVCGCNAPLHKTRQPYALTSTASAAPSYCVLIVWQTLV